MNTISVFDFSLHSPFLYHMTGKFVAPDDQWKHLDFPLTDFELILMTEGVLYMEYQKQRYEIHENEFLLLPPGEEPDNHRVGYKSAYCSFYWLHFMPTQPFSVRTLKTSDVLPTLQFPRTLPGENILLPVQWKVPNRDKMIFLMKQMQNDVRSEYSSLTLGCEASALLCDLADQLRMESAAMDSAENQKQIFSDIIDYIHLNTSMNLTVADIARKFGYNQGYLSHTFARYSGTTLKQFILKCKMDEANRLLSDTNLPIAEISQSLGYKDTHNFSKSYKKYTGITPSDYRKTYAKRLLYHV